MAREVPDARTRREEARLHKLGVLRLIQENNKTKHADIAAKVGIGEPRVSGIIEELNKSGEIKDNKAILDPAKFGLKDLFFVQINLINNTPDIRNKTIESIKNYNNVQGIYRVDGQFNILVKLRGDSAEASSDFIDYINLEGNTRSTNTITVTVTIMDVLDIHISDD